MGFNGGIGIFRVLRAVRCLVRVYCHLVPVVFLRVELLLPYVPVAGLVCGGGPHGVLALSLRKRNKHMRCMKHRCIVVASTWCLLCGFVLTCMSLLSCRAVLVRLALCVWRGISRLIKLNFYGVCCLCVSQCDVVVIIDYTSILYNKDCCVSD